MAKRKIYTPEEKERAIAIYVESGRKEAELQTGINGKTIAAWASLAGLATDTNENRKKAIEAAQLEDERRWARIKAKVGIEAEAALDDMRKPYNKIVKFKEGGELVMEVFPDPGDRAKLATVYGILFDKNQLATGGPTANTVTQTPDLKGLVDAQKQKNETAKAELMARVLGATE